MNNDNAAPQNPALNRQQVQVLLADIETLRQLYQTYKDSPNRIQFGAIYSRINEYLQRIEELVSTIVLEEGELKRLQEEKKYLDTLIFEMLGEIAKIRRERRGHWKREKETAESGENDENEEAEDSDGRGFGRHHHGPFGPWDRHAFGGHHGAFGHWGHHGRFGSGAHHGEFGPWDRLGGFGPWERHGAFGFGDRHGSRGGMCPRGGRGGFGGPRGMFPM